MSTEGWIIGGTVFLLTLLLFDYFRFSAVFIVLKGDGWNCSGARIYENEGVHFLCSSEFTTKIINIIFRLIIGIVVKT